MSELHTHFERFEYKYWVPEERAQAFLRGAAPFLKKDSWAPGGQRNTSLYLDSPELDFFRMHTESAPDRLKLRVRAYGDPPRGLAFFEIKRKVKAVILKRRAVVPMEAVARLLDPGLGDATLPVLRSAEEERTLSHFLYLMAVHQAEPRALITCRREAFSGEDPDEQMRITLDRDICYQPAVGPSLAGDPRAWVPLIGQSGYEAGASTLIEVKFRGYCPLWMEDLVQRLHLRPSAFSKYVAAMSHAELPALELLATEMAPTWAQAWGA